MHVYKPVHGSDCNKKYNFKFTKLSIHGYIFWTRSWQKWKLKKKKHYLMTGETVKKNLPVFFLENGRGGLPSVFFRGSWAWRGVTRFKGVTRPSRPPDRRPRQRVRYPHPRSQSPSCLISLIYIIKQTPDGKRWKKMENMPFETTSENRNESMKNNEMFFIYSQWILLNFIKLINFSMHFHGFLIIFREF